MRQFHKRKSTTSNHYFCLNSGRVRLLFSKGHSCFRERRTGERRRKSVRGCIVDANLSVLAVVVVKKGEQVRCVTYLIIANIPIIEMNCLIRKSLAWLTLLCLSDWVPSVLLRSANFSTLLRKMTLGSTSSSDHCPRRKERNNVSVLPRFSVWLPQLFFRWVYLFFFLIHSPITGPN